ncbi:hypothetical protein Baya_7191 [Bagarius yarrelli]|uniref:Uncharacterized protein n=1 Tax=Bagarius yarrelli TaxID=175774 RepID=A0A556TZI5_BAGYA|nr:hypothetical protein Baya_7191 [Bagarius yarrelli]
MDVNFDLRLFCRQYQGLWSWRSGYELEELLQLIQPIMRQRCHGHQRVGSQWDLAPGTGARWAALNTTVFRVFHRSSAGDEGEVSGE